MGWDGLRWVEMGWDGLTWTDMGWHGLGCVGMGWDAGGLRVGCEWSRSTSGVWSTGGSEVWM